MSVLNRQIRFMERPKGEVDISRTFKEVTETISTRSEDLKFGTFLVKIHYLSLDPAMRGWMNKVRSYIPPIEIGSVMRSVSLGTVVASQNSKYKPGDIVMGPFGWQEYAITNGIEVKKTVSSVPKGISPRAMLSTLGTTGLTGFFGFFEVGKPKPGDTVVVSGAAGATGSVVGQMAKICGCRVVGIAGSDEKCRWLKEELGFDVALNYKSPDYHKEFVQATPKFVDVYFDNVGGKTLDYALERINLNGRIVVCGGISQYNTAKPYGPQKYMNLISQRAKMEGFIVFDYKDKYPQAIAKMTDWILDGKLKSKEHIVEGLENAPQGLLDLFKGVNTGKMLVKISDEIVKSKL
ncbi:zinc-binding dehydrogenase [Basidiobolus meristosporus CBS 931.73]|uniref:Zinc-binding dehydrogenase n=1 Tax=Basidiobolus meristosporus CBS 931.73 TaxID=1314790 RepID=A0A1Y1YMS7_9FUNG|nr:zinc-binding dehydrogenase [Basidiobolus meristosporus CBS 931.73]|eukprot:ORX99317.1 zinc-binding dehydrogenase [Basidiobolus meristosporus CBS 931.73]